MDTIFALASARAKSGVAVIRISGPKAWDAGRTLCNSLPPVRQAGLRTIRRSNGELLDTAIVVAYASGASFTSEPTIELMVHGGVATIVAIESELDKLDGLRIARPGEFTRRALDAGQIDLTQVEALADLLDAETEKQRLQALRILQGGLGRLVAPWRHALISAASRIEASIDFADELIDDQNQAVLQLLRPVLDQMNSEIAGHAMRSAIRSGFEIAIVGPVNSGKSTLLNRLAGREAAITSSVAGTTRDVIEVRMDIGGFPVTFLDTAGIRESRDPVERIGIERGIERASNADLRIMLLENQTARPPLDMRESDIALVAKSDLYPSVSDGISGLTGDGIDDLLMRIQAHLSKHFADDGVTMRDRHLRAIDAGAASLRSAIDRLEGAEPAAELVAADLRACIVALDMLIGKVDVEDLLDDVFASFCIGK